MNDVDSLDPFSASWPRFSRYEVRNGRLCPSPQSDIEFYDPWELYAKARTKAIGDEAPHQQFLNLRQQMPARVQEAMRRKGYVAMAIADDDATKVLSGWAERFGLLGLLVSNLRRIVLVPRWTQLESMPRGNLLPVQHIHDYSSPAWRTEKRVYDWPYLIKAGRDRSQARVGRPVSADLFRRALAQDASDDQCVADKLNRSHPSAIVKTDAGTPRPYDGEFPLSKQDLIRLLKEEFDGGRRLGDSDWRSWAMEPPHALIQREDAIEQVDLSSLARYFPDVPERERETFLYPQPLSDAFWRGYGEPVEEISRALMRLRWLVSDLVADRVRADQGVRIGSGNQLTEDQRSGLASLVEEPEPMSLRRRRLAADHLQEYLHNTYQRIVVTQDGRLQQRWVSSSLLNSLAMMVVRDVTEGKQWLRQCRTCGRMFMARSYQQRSCSTQCTWNYHKRRQRADERFLTRGGPMAARRLAKQGLSVRKIHAYLQGQVSFTISLALVREWLAGDESEA